MRICVLHCVGSEVVNLGFWAPWHTFENVFLEKATAVQRIQEFAATGLYDLYFNFCDGLPGAPEPGLEVVNALEELGLPFTGAHAAFYQITKEEMKRKADAAGVSTPAWAPVNDVEQALAAAEWLTFPLIVKDHNGFGSFGLRDSSRVSNREELAAEVERMVRDRGGAIVEEFIEGREFTVLVSENPADPETPVILAPVEVRFANGRTFKTQEVKWVTFARDMAWVPCRDEAMSALLIEETRRAWKACGGNGYGRADFRVRQSDGKPFFLEINANPGIFFGYDSSNYGSADFCIHYDPSWTHEKFLALLLSVATKRKVLVEARQTPTPACDQSSSASAGPQPPLIAGTALA